MTTETTKPKVTLTVSEQLTKIEEKRARVYRNILRDALANHPSFTKMKESFNKAKRYLSEAESLVTQEGYAKQKERLENKVLEINEEIKALDGKRNAAVVAVPKLRDVVKEHEAVQTLLGTKLAAVLEDKNATITDEAINAVITEALSSVNVDSLPVAVDPLADFRATK